MAESTTVYVQFSPGEEVRVGDELKMHGSFAVWRIKVLRIIAVKPLGQGGLMQVKMHVLRTMIVSKK